MSVVAPGEVGSPGGQVALFTTLPSAAAGLEAARPLHRLEAIGQRLASHPIAGVREHRGRLADRAMLERIHTGRYLDHLWWLRTAAGAVYEHRAVLPGSLEQILWSAGSVLDAVEHVLDGKSSRAAALVEPPGHHAEADQSMGFCAINNVAVAVAHALATRKLSRVLIVDWDVHHGNGTQHAFEARQDVLFVDFHQHPFFPGTGPAHEVGTGAGRGFTVNVPLPPGQGDGDYLQAFRVLLEPLAAWYRPELVVVSAGYDAHAEDPLGEMGVTSEGFAALTGLVCSLADAYAGGRVVLALEGGYNARALAESVHGCVQVLAGATAPQVAVPAGGGVAGALARVRGAHRGLLGSDGWC